MQYLFVVLCVFGLGCATVSRGSPGTPLAAAGRETASRRLSVSSRVVEECSSPRLPTLEFTFENRTSSWQRVKLPSLKVADAKLNERVFVPVGADLESWRTATLQTQAIRHANQQTALELLLVGGWATSELANNPHVGLAGSLVGLGAASGLLVTRTRDRIHEAEGSWRVPENHLLAGPFSVPPGLFAKKWIVLYTPDLKNARDTAFVMDYEFADGQRESVLLNAAVRKARARGHGR